MYYIFIYKFSCRGYISPEVIHCGRITFKSDMYSLGVIILEILTGNEDYDVRIIVILLLCTIPSFLLDAFLGSTTSS